MAKKQSASPKSFAGILAVVGIAGVAVLGYVVSRPPKVITLDPGAPTLAAAGVVKGSPDALVEIVEFADFECPGCGYYATITGPDVMARLVETGEVRFRFMDLPLDIHRNAVPAHNAAHCANEQQRFWEMHDLIFRAQDKWNAQATRSPKRVLEGLARQLGLDMRQWNDCYDSGRMLPQIAANRAEAMRLRIGTTPSFVIGGQLFPGNLSYDQLRQAVTVAKVQALADESDRTGRPATASATKAP